MATLTGSFTYGPAPSTVAVAVEYDPPPQFAEAPERAIFGVEMTLHLPPDMRADTDGFSSDSPNVSGLIAYDRDPGSAALGVEVVPRGDFLLFDLVATVDGLAMHDRCRSGGPAHLAWRVPMPPAPRAAPPTGEVKAVELEGSVGAAGDATATPG